MWGRNGPVTGGVGRGSVGTENGALSENANVFYIKPQIFNLKMYKCLQNVNISLEICVTSSGRKSGQNGNISFEICVKVSHLIHNVNISYEICATVAGSCADPFKVNISFEICSNVFQLI